MQRTLSLGWIALYLIAVPAILTAPGYAASVERIRNHKAVVTEVTLAPGETISLPDKRPAMLVYLTGNAAEMLTNDGKVRKESVKRGDTVFQPAEESSIKNDGASTLSFVRVEFLTAGNPETWGRTGLAPNYKVLLENRYGRAYDIKITAQKFEPQHSHHDRVVICLSGAQLEHILPNGEKQPSTLKTGDIAWRLAATHIGHNMGHTNLWVIAVEPK
ncbi:MAG TPA: hypothetical protein VMW15_13510 [Terracidiphilus sp.]|nr:hypothetical protein [Terracidiphilus sp.]